MKTLKETNHEIAVQWGTKRKRTELNEKGMDKQRNNRARDELKNKKRFENKLKPYKTKRIETKLEHGKAYKEHGKARQSRTKRKTGDKTAKRETETEQTGDRTKKN